MCPTDRHTVVWEEPPISDGRGAEDHGLRYRAVVSGGDVEEVWVQPTNSVSGTYWRLTEVEDDFLEIMRVAGRALHEDRTQAEAADAR